MATNWGKNTEQIVQFVLVAIVGFGLALYLGATFQTALPSGSLAANTVGNIISGTGNAITNVFIPIISVAFLLFLYLLVKSSGILGGKTRD